MPTHRSVFASLALFVALAASSTALAQSGGATLTLDGTLTFEGSLTLTIPPGYESLPEAPARKKSFSFPWPRPASRRAV